MRTVVPETLIAHVSADKLTTKYRYRIGFRFLRRL
jgi:hypothetical protein